MVNIAMMVAGVGMQFFNNYANNKKNTELQAKQREYQIASAEHDFERMRRIQAESARIALEMEEELHQERMSDINNQYDSLLENFSQGFSISNWPLNVLPFIMKGESFGSLINGTSNSINMHCIFTPSNCDWFNEIFYDDLDLRVEAEMNNHWNAQSSHPIVYYGGGWNRRTMKKGFPFPEQIDLNDIDLLKVNLKNVPMMVITPYFDPWLHFRIELWGMGKDSSVPFRIDIPHGEIDYTTRIFSYDYNKDHKDGIYEDDFQNVTIEEFVPYLVRLIGFVADKYFWSMYGVEPCLPQITQLIASNTQLVKQSVHDYYLQLLRSTLSLNRKENDCAYFSKERMMSMYLGAKPIMNLDEQKEILTTIIGIITGRVIGNTDYKDSLDYYFTSKDLPFLKKLINETQDIRLKEKLISIYEDIESQVACSFIYYDDITVLDILEHAKLLCDSNTGNVKVDIHEDHAVVSLLAGDGISLVNDIDNPKCYILQFKNIIVTDRIRIKSNSFILQRNRINSLYEQVKQMY